MIVRFLAVASLFFFVAASHKNHTGDYKMSEMPPPPRITGIGDSHLEITTKSAKAQAYFDQGLNLLHCFWDFDSADETGTFLAEAFGEAGTTVASTLKRPRLSYNVAIYHRSKPAPGTGAGPARPVA